MPNHQPKRHETRGTPGPGKIAQFFTTEDGVRVCEYITPQELTESLGAAPDKSTQISEPVNTRRMPARTHNAFGRPLTEAEETGNSFGRHLPQNETTNAFGRSRED